MDNNLAAHFKSDNKSNASPKYTYVIVKWPLKKESVSQKGKFRVMISICEFKTFYSKAPYNSNSTTVHRLVLMD